jgi:hypothetical protein
MSVTFNGTLNEVKAGAPVSGVLVTITVTKPDVSIETITKTTDVTGKFTDVKDYTLPGTYTAVASFAGNSSYNAAASSVINFNVAKQDVVITLNVTLS